MTLNQDHEAWVLTAKPIVKFPGNRSARKKTSQRFLTRKKSWSDDIRSKSRDVVSDAFLASKTFFFSSFPPKKVTQTWPRFVGSHFFGCRTRKLKTSKQLIFWSRCNERILNLAPFYFLAWPLKFLQRPGVSQLPAPSCQIWDLT